MTNRKMMEYFLRFLDENRSRYEEQAQILLSEKELETQVKNYKINYALKDGVFSSEAKPLSKNLNHFGFEVPIPNKVEHQIEELVQLFAKSEAACK